MRQFDLLIIGGGINGAGIARDAGGRGLSVCLVEQDDLAAHTSSASTKLIHGGLRYLEYYEFRLVREALIERERLLGIAPHIIWPMRFVLPHAPTLRPRWLLRLGLFVYDHIGARKRLPASKSVRLRQRPLGAPLKDHLHYGFMYSDCWVQDSRLVVLNALDAAERGARILPRTRLVEAVREGNRWLATLEDMHHPSRERIYARAIVNAAGAWVSEILSTRLRIESRKHIRLVKGSHIVVPRLYDGDHAYFLQNPDGRIEFVIPYEERYSLIGTTDVPFTGDPSEVRISDDEIAYLCDSVNRYFKRQLTSADVVWSYAGVRPLYDDAAENAAAVTRDYELELAHESGAPATLSVFGGKITTYRRLAEHALEKLQPHVGGAEESWTGATPLPGGDFPTHSDPHAAFERFVAHTQSRWPFLPRTMTTRLCRAYGTRIAHILGAAKSLEDLGADFGAGLTAREVNYLCEHEWARTSDDILWRRSKLGLHLSEEQRAKLADYLARRALTPLRQSTDT